MQPRYGGVKVEGKDWQTGQLCLQHWSIAELYAHGRAHLRAQPKARDSRGDQDASKAELAHPAPLLL